MDIEKDLNATVIQSLARRYIVRKAILQTLNERYEKIYDPKRKKYFYYDTRTDTSSWEKPRLFLKSSDISKLSSIYSRDEAATVIQSRARGRSSLHRVRVLYQSCTKASKDPATGNTFYYNSKTRRTMWQLPAFMSGKLNYGTPKAALAASKSFSLKRDKSVNEDDSMDSKSDISEDSETVIKRRRMNRTFPRSKSQLLVDTVEDDMDEQLSLDLSGIGARHITSRIYDFSPLTALNISGNRLRRISDDIQYLASLTTLDISNNMISKIPKEIEELVQLKELRASHNHLETYPGHLYKLRTLKVFDMSYNRFKAIPIETGNLELLKELNQWDVGVGVLISLTTLDFSHCFLTDWPPQLENLAQLTHLNLSHNSITAVPSQISALVSLKVLDLSNNQINSLSDNIYLQSITELLLNDNQLTALPPFTSVQTQTMSSMNFINLSNNKITSLGEQLFLFHHVEKFLASFNCIESVHDSVASMKALKYLDLSHNQLVDITNALISCNRLTYLDLSNNRLSRVPLALSGTNRMLELYLQHNEINDISGKVYAMLMDLRRLRLDHNRLSHLAPLFYTMKKLEYLNLSHNQLVAIEESIGQMKGLNELYLNVNKLTAIPDQICVLTNLTCLDMEYNRIAHLPLQLSQLKNLRRITLHSNELQLSPHLLITLPYLLHCNLSWNKLATASMVNKNYKYKTEYISMELLKGKLDQAHFALDDALSQSHRPRILFKHEQSESNGDEDIAETDGGEEPDDDGQVSSEGKKPKRRKKKTPGSNQSELTQTWFSQLQEYFRIFADDDEPLKDIQLLENMTKDLLIQHQSSEQLNRCRLQLRSILAAARQHGRGVPIGISIHDYVRFDGARVYSSTDADDVSAVSVLNVLDWGAEYQDLIDQFQRCSNEVAALAIVEELQCLQASSAALSSGKEEVNIIPEKEPDNSKLLSSRFFSFKKEKEPPTTPDKQQATAPGATSKPVNNSSAMEKVDQVAVQKKNIIDFSRLPFIYNFSPPEITRNLRGKLSEMMCSCYLGLGRALLGRAEKLRDDIREVEIRGKLRTSCLDIAQRQGDDFADIIKDYYDDLVARAATISAGKDDDDYYGGGEDGPAEAGAPVSAKRRTLKKPVITLSSAPAAVDGLEDDATSAGGDDSEAVSDASGGGADRKHKKKGKASKSKHKAKHKEKEKEKEKPVAKPKPISAVKKRDIPLKELLRSTALDELLHPVPWRIASVCVDFLSKNRLLTLLWAMKCLEAVSEILALNGWDPTTVLKAKTSKLVKKKLSENSRNDGRDGGDGGAMPEWVRLGASQIHLMKAKLFGYLMWYKEAESELNIYLSMLTADAPKSTIIYLIKIHIAQGNFFLAQKALNALVDKLALAAERDKASKKNKQVVTPASLIPGEVQLPPSLEMDIMNIIKLDKEVGLLKCIADAYVSSLRSEGFLSPEQMQLFHVQDNGLLSMNRLHFPPESLNGRSLRDQELEQGSLDRKQVELAREAEAGERENVDQQLQKCIEMARNVLLIPI